MSPLTRSQASLAPTSEPQHTMRNPKRIAVLTTLVLVLSACAANSTSNGRATGPTAPGDAPAGALVYTRGCSSCHGDDLGGVDGLGKGLSPSDYVNTHTEDEVAELIIVGVPANDPLNMTGIDMSPRGGNPSLTDQDMADVAAYLKSEQ